MCTINEDLMMYGSWDIKARQTEFFEILGHFLPFGPPNNPKNQNFEKMKKILGDIITLHLCTTNGDHVITVPGIWSATDIIFYHFGPIFALLSPNNPPENRNFEKMKKRPGDIIILQKCTINENHMIYGS